MGRVWRDSRGRFSPKTIPYDYYVVAEMEGNKVRAVHASNVKLSQVVATLQECRQAGCDIRTHKPFTTQKMKNLFRLLQRTVNGYKQVRFAGTGNAV